ncbi:hypothetical protein FRB99_005129 [Tulasnella sp. 403]|nr:hypothetical protein FRB99_005129 [Tulasnella sp. 403]
MKPRWFDADGSSSQTSDQKRLSQEQRRQAEAINARKSAQKSTRQNDSDEENETIDITLANKAQDTTNNPARQVQVNGKLVVPPYNKDQCNPNNDDGESGTASSTSSGLQNIEHLRQEVARMENKQKKQHKDLEGLVGLLNRIEDGGTNESEEELEESAGGRTRSGALNAFQSVIRQYLRQLLGVRQTRLPSGQLVETEYPAGPSDIDNPPEYRDGRLENFTFAWDLPINHEYNLLAAEAFAKGLIHEERYAHFEFNDSDEPEITHAVLAHLKYLRQKRKKQEQPDVPEKTIHQRLSKSARERRRRLFMERLALVRSTPELEEHADVFRTLTPAGMSSDDDDGPNELYGHMKTYSISRKRWRSPALEQFCRTLTHHQVKDSARIGGKRGIMRHRVQTDRISPSAAVPGLPRNFYNEAWLAKQNKGELRRLKITDEHVLPTAEELEQYLGGSTSDSETGPATGK